MSSLSSAHYVAAPPATSKESPTALQGQTEAYPFGLHRNSRSALRTHSVLLGSRSHRVDSRRDDKDDDQVVSLAATNSDIHTASLFSSGSLSSRYPALSLPLGRRAERGPRRAVPASSRRARASYISLSYEDLGMLAQVFRGQKTEAPPFDARQLSSAKPPEVASLSTRLLEHFPGLPLAGLNG